MYKKLILISVIIIFFSDVHAQDTLSSVSRKNYKLAYYGNMIFNPGMCFGFEKTLTFKDYNFTKTKKQNVITVLKRKEFLFDANIGMFFDPNSYTAIFSNAGISYRKTKIKSTKSIGLNPIGIYRSILKNTYEVSSNNEVSRLFLAGNTYFAPTINFEYGRLLKQKILKESYLASDFMFLFGYNAQTIIPLINIEFGFRF